VHAVGAGATGQRLEVAGKALRAALRGGGLELAQQRVRARGECQQQLPGKAAVALE